MTHIFIVNPEAGNSSTSENLRERLGKIKGIKSFIFVTHHKGYEIQLVKRIKRFFEGEKLRIYCCGGSGTMRNILSAFDDISDTEFAFYPCGKTNDFLKATGVDPDRFSDIEALINGTVVDVDYIRSNHGIALNTISVGLDAEMGRKVEDYEFMGAFEGWFPYFMAILHAMFVAESHRYGINVDNKKIDCRSAEVIFTNGNSLGGTLGVSEKCDIFDGVGGYMIASKHRPIAQIPLLSALMKKDYRKIYKLTQCGSANKFKLRRASGNPFTANFDGEMVYNITEIEAEIVRQGLHFVMPAEPNGGVSA